jgi:hypothetical protein
VEVVYALGVVLAELTLLADLTGAAATLLEVG